MDFIQFTALNINSISSNATFIEADTCNAYSHLTLDMMLYSFFMSLILVSSVVGNSIVILAVVLSPTLKHRPTFHFAASLAVSDMIWALCQIPFRISVKLHGMQFCFGIGLCYIRIVVDAFSNVASILNLFFISVDRFIAVQLPYRYILMLSTGRSKKILIGIWSSSALWSISCIFRWENSSLGLLSIQIGRMCQNSNSIFYVVSFLGIYIPILLIISCTYARILNVALTQIRKIEKHVSIHETMRASVSNALDHKNSCEPRRRGSLMKELKATKSIAIVYLAFCICWLPSCIMINLYHFNKDVLKMDKDTFQSIWFIFCDVLPIMTTMINPIIYSFSNTQFRKAVQYVWQKLWRKTAIWDSSFVSRRTNRLSSNVSASTVKEMSVHRTSSTTITRSNVIQMQLDI